MRRCILGIDTSNYTTSVCAVDADTGQWVSEARRVLPVKHGERGLRQSDALFFHVQQLPQMVRALMGGFSEAARVTWCGIGVSVQPRPQAASYMPVFRAGESVAETVGALLGAPVVRTSHQEGHIAAATYFLPDMTGDRPFLAVHLSGGTSDVVLAEGTRFGYRVTPVAEGADLHAGQFVDRVGVAMGLPFPAGPHLEQLARRVSSSTLRLGGRLVNGRLSFSGPCSAALRAIEAGVDHAEVAYAVQQCIANALVKAVDEALRRVDVNVSDCVIAGGVAANEAIRDRVCRRLGILRPDLRVRFAPARYSSDNALGVARIAWKFLFRGR